MGSAFTVEEPAMQTIMEEIKRQGLFFVDSRTSVNTTAQQVADRVGVPNASRQVFLDNDRSVASLSKQFEYTKRLAKRNGTVVVIAHPYPETITFLAHTLPSLANEGIALASVNDYFTQVTNTPNSTPNNTLVKEVHPKPLLETEAAAPNE
jgi:polysaccharide deacetylase 2 family uncharacterized protein YibQ